MSPKRSTVLVKETPEPDYPWDRQPGESPQAFAAFAVYRDMGVYRDQRAVARVVKKQRSLLGRWSITYEWVSRVSAWDAWNDAELRKLKEAERRKALDAQLKLGKQMMESAAETIAAKRDSDTPSLEDKDVPNYAKAGQALVAAALGPDSAASEQATQFAIFREAVLRGIDEADEATGQHVRQHIDQQERARVANGG
jgi:hypothetical protein